MGSKLQQRILKERGLIKVSKHKPQRNTFAKFAPAPRITVAGKSKTPLMRYLEQKYHVAMEEVLVSGSLSVVAKGFGNEVDVSTISRWISRFKLRYSETNLPDCNGCRHWEIACEGGICHVLMELEEWDLVWIKRQEIFIRIKVGD